MVRRNTPPNHGKSEDWDNPWQSNSIQAFNTIPYSMCAELSLQPHLVPKVRMKHETLWALRKLLIARAQSPSQNNATLLCREASTKIKPVHWHFHTESIHSGWTTPNQAICQHCNVLRGWVPLLNRKDPLVAQTMRTAGRNESSCSASKRLATSSPPSPPYSQYSKTTSSTAQGGGGSFRIGNL